MLAIAALIFAGVAFLVSVGTFGLIAYGVKRLAKGLVAQPEPRVTKGEMAFDHAKPELAVKMPGGVTRYVCSDGTMRDEHAAGGSIEPPVVGGPPIGNVIPLFGSLGGE